MTNRMSWFVATLTLTGAVHGQDTTVDLQRCQAIESHLERLECYDQLARQSDGASIEKTQPPAPNPTPGSNPKQPRPPSKVITSAATTSTTAKTEPTPPDARRTDPPKLRKPIEESGSARPIPDDFGEPAKPDKFDKREFTTNIVKVDKLQRGNHRIALEGGQVWQEIEYDVRTDYSVGDEVTIREGLFGTYNVLSKRTGRRNKVKRIE